MLSKSILIVMAELAELFTSLQSNKSDYLQSNKGKDFERRVEHRLDRIGYLQVNPSDLPNIANIKAVIKDRITPDFPVNSTDYRRHYLMQPFGTQDYPDFLVMDADRIIGIETKYSNTGKKKPVWNSGLPRCNGIYIFGSYFPTSDITFFVGGSVLTLADIEKLHEFFADLKDQQGGFNVAEMSAQPYGFEAYSRKAFGQSKQHNPNAILDFFSNPKRADLEARVISDVQRL